MPCRYYVYLLEIYKSGLFRKSLSLGDLINYKFVKLICSKWVTYEFTGNYKLIKIITWRFFTKYKNKI